MIQKLRVVSEDMSTNTLIDKNSFGYDVDSQFPQWQEMSLWPKATRYIRYDQFLEFVAKVSRLIIPRRIKSSW